jgi:hypothetical protein
MRRTASAEGADGLACHSLFPGEHISGRGLLLGLEFFRPGSKARIVSIHRGVNFTTLGRHPIEQ